MYSPEQYRALTGGAGVVDRSSRGRLQVTGADRRTYLQGLLTNDIVALEEGTGCYAAYLTPQGRMIADLRVFETGQHPIVDLDARLTDSIRERWEQLIFSEDVKIANITDATAEIGIYGPASARAVTAICDVREEEIAALPLHGSRHRDGSLIVASDDIGIRGFDVIVPIPLKDEALRRAAEAGAVTIDQALAEAVRIQAGRPLLMADMNEDTIPLEAGIEDRAISLTKGCYVGQEVIIRVLHRGHGRVARRLVRLEFQTGAPVPAPGDAIVSGDKEIGRITSAAASPSTGRAVALGYVQRDFASSGAAVEVRNEAGRVPATVVL